MDDITLEGKKYLSSKQAAKVTGYAKDYVGQLCREGRVDARLVGRNWYVLESSILEHRFGAEDPVQEVSEPQTIPQEPTTRWAAPVYVTETVQAVPELAPKASPDNKQVLTDMQSAWQEWFQTQKNAEKSLPDASEMLLEDHAEEPEDPKEEIAPVYTSRTPEIQPQEVFEAEEEEYVPIHVERATRHYSAPQESQIEEVYDEPEEYVAPRREVQPRLVVKEPVRRHKTARNKAINSNSFILRAIFISVAGLAVAVAIIGTGLVDRFIQGPGASSFVTDFFAGVHEVSK